MIRLILMRHGNTFEEGQTALQIGARTDLSLVTKGRLQAEQMAEFLRETKIQPKAIYAGELKRQMESAGIIANYFGLPVQKSAALTEIDYGSWEGLTAEEIAKKWPKEYIEWVEEAKWQSSIFRGTYEDHRKRLTDWLDHLKVAFDDALILAITSNGLLRFFKNEKVKTGHYCELNLFRDEIRISCWNQSPCLKI